ncbi:MAG TPA: neutral/alkaline non-lysosomal ceramidase N-terminal domain-containing protein [Blastocatellia bacterium]|nr:neutral/alkaline non-lysosomal ceramidase N-terminal domain-containing protein [Blastocatellia bacterium]
MSKSLFVALLLVAAAATLESAPRRLKNELKVGVSAISITPFGPNPEWDGTVTQSGVWGESFTDSNRNGRWDAGEPFVDDDGNTALDPSSRGKYDGIYLAGFGNNRIATGKHDDYWARAMVLEHGVTRIAIVAVDVIGYYSKANYYGLGEIKKLVDPKLGIGEILIASTHNHEAPDTIGPWGANALSDGKYPKYLRFIDRQIAKAINQAARSVVPARMKLGRTDPQLSPSIAGMQTRTGGRPPRFFDEEMRVMQFFGTGARDKVIATLINWNTHPESMEDKNTAMTSDFPHAVRETVEKKYGGIAVYVSGDIGAVEIIGDTNNKRGDRTTFDGKEFPLKPENNRPVFTHERTEAIGRDVARAVFDALDRGEWSAVNGIILKKATLRAPMDNAAYLFLASRSVLDTMPPPEGGKTPEIESSVHAITIGDAQIITTPGELFPEVFYGVEKNRRRDCPEADTKRPAEPGVRDRMRGKYKFVFGLCPDEFGYIVPGYDFLPPSADPARGLRQAQDPCKAAGVPNHYHETNSASSQLARAWACVAAALLDGRTPDTAACSGDQRRRGTRFVPRGFPRYASGFSNTRRP